MSRRFATPADVAWIREPTAGGGLTIGSAIPLRYAAYATLVIPEDGEHERRDRELAERLRSFSPAGPWWFGFLENGAEPLPHPDGPRVRLYANWPYVVVQGAPHEVLTWRGAGGWKGMVPDLVFPDDRSWLVSTLWDDDWRCVGGPAGLVESLVTADEDATPPGHTPSERAGAPTAARSRPDLGASDPRAAAGGRSRHAAPPRRRAQCPTTCSASWSSPPTTSAMPVAGTASSSTRSTFSVAPTRRRSPSESRTDLGGSGVVRRQVMRARGP